MGGVALYYNAVDASLDYFETGLGGMEMLCSIFCLQAGGFFSLSRDCFVGDATGLKATYS